MTGRTLNGCHVLVAEDEYLLASDITHALTEAGAIVLGPAPSIEEALALVLSAPRIDLALLDVNLRGDMVFPVADALVERGTAFAFATGYDPGTLPDRFAAVPRLEKPLPSRLLTRELALLLSPA